MAFLITCLIAIVIVSTGTANGEMDFPASSNDEAVVTSNLLKLTTISPRMKNINWPDEINVWNIGRSPNAIFNQKVRDEMERRVSELQKKIDKGKGILSDEERTALGMEILHNFQTQREMREMQRTLDKGGLPDNELREVKEKLTNMTNEIKMELLNLTVLLDSSNQRNLSRSKRNVQKSEINPQPSVPDFNIPSSYNIKHSRLKDNHMNPNQPSYNLTEEPKGDRTDGHQTDFKWKVEETTEQMEDSNGNAIEEKAESILMDAMRRAGLNMITKIEDNSFRFLRSRKTVEKKHN